VKWEEAKHLTKKDVQIALHKPIKKYSDSHDIEIIIQKL